MVVGAAGGVKAVEAKRNVRSTPTYFQFFFLRWQTGTTETKYYKIEDRQAHEEMVDRASDEFKTALTATEAALMNTWDIAGANFIAAVKAEVAAQLEDLDAVEQARQQHELKLKINEVHDRTENAIKIMERCIRDYN